MEEGRGNYQELTEFSNELYDHNAESTSTPGQTTGLEQRSFSGHEPLLSPPTTYQPSPDLSDDANRSGSNLNVPFASQGAKSNVAFSALRDSSFHENLSPQDQKAAISVPRQTIFDG